MERMISQLTVMSIITISSIRLDPHTTTHNMSIRNNWIHDNPIGPICSDRCYDILIEGNLIEDTDMQREFFSQET